MTPIAWYLLLTVVFSWAGVLAMLYHLAGAKQQIDVLKERLRVAESMVPEPPEIPETSADVVASILTGSMK